MAAIRELSGYPSGFPKLGDVDSGVGEEIVGRIATFALDQVGTTNWICGLFLLVFLETVPMRIDDWEKVRELVLHRRGFTMAALFHGYATPQHAPFAAAHLVTAGQEGWSRLNVCHILGATPYKVRESGQTFHIWNREHPSPSCLSFLLDASSYLLKGKIDVNSHPLRWVCNSCQASYRFSEIISDLSLLTNGCPAEFQFCSGYTLRMKPQRQDHWIWIQKSTNGPVSPFAAWSSSRPASLPFNDQTCSEFYQKPKGASILKHYLRHYSSSENLKA
nr:hypothetical protein Iba_chr01cCG6120 [Ipomoea batatas]